MGTVKRHRTGAWGALGVCMLAAAVAAQTPQPFPRGGTPAPAAVSPSTPQAPAARVPMPVDPDTPTETQLGLPISPTAQFITSYDAGRGQRYYLFGSSLPFAEVVSYYKTVLKEKGNVVFEQPPTHMFEIGKFREETMAFPPGVTVKDYTWGGSAGYPNPKRGTQPERFATIIQIVPAPSTLPIPAKRR